MQLEDRYLLYREAIDHYGAEHQEDKVMEEMAELTQAIIKHRQNPCKETYMNLLEEIADVTNTQEQLKMIHCNHLNEEEVLLMIREEKLEKMKNEIRRDKEKK